LSGYRAIEARYRIADAGRSPRRGGFIPRHRCDRYCLSDRRGLVIQFDSAQQGRSPRSRANCNATVRAIDRFRTPRRDRLRARDRGQNGSDFDADHADSFPETATQSRTAGGHLRGRRGSSI